MIMIKNEIKERVFSPLIAGILIGIAGTVYLNVGGVVGAVLFGFGLMCVVAWKINLFTGKSGFWSGRMIWRLIPVLLLNIAGVAMVAMITMKPETSELALSITGKRLVTSPMMLFLLSCCCGFIMTTAVKFGREGNWWPLIFGVPTFILCGFPHCVADIYYWTVAIVNGEDILTILPIYLVTVAGNYAGCNLPRLIPGFIADPAPARTPVDSVADSDPSEA